MVKSVHAIAHQKWEIADWQKSVNWESTRDSVFYNAHCYQAGNTGPHIILYRG